ncbi:MAG: SIS domain-containing protein [Capsulimonadales bacterium]|nr:SIS domain-containing protein [Capsulimonadales bacterium]
MTTIPPAGKQGDTLPDTSGGTEHYIRDYFSGLKALLEAVDATVITRIVDILLDAYRNDRRLVMCGNGGSGSTSSHMICDFQKNILLDGGKPFEAIALTDSPALLSAWGNDTSFENIFAGQARTWLRKDDVLIAISGSGNSPNILKAVETANEIGAFTIGFCGYGGGKLAGQVQLAVIVDRRNMQQVEDLHMILGHVVYSALRDRIKGILVA